MGQTLFMRPQGILLEITCTRIFTTSVDINPFLTFKEHGYVCKELTWKAYKGQLKGLAWDKISSDCDQKDMIML